jgi:hypothetical protein
MMAQREVSEPQLFRSSGKERLKLALAAGGAHTVHKFTNPLE